MCDHVALTCLSIDSGLRRRCDSGLPRSMCRASMLQARAGFRCTQMSARMLSSANIAFLVGPLLPFELTSLLMMSAIACTMRWGNLSVSLGSLMRSMIVLHFFTIVGRFRDECKCSESS